VARPAVPPRPIQTCDTPEPKHALVTGSARTALHAEARFRSLLLALVGATGFEPATFRPPAERLRVSMRP
jgi:hypothetical protein